MLLHFTSNFVFCLFPFYISIFIFTNLPYFSSNIFNSISYHPFNIFSFCHCCLLLPSFFYVSTEIFTKYFSYSFVLSYLCWWIEEKGRFVCLVKKKKGIFCFSVQFCRVTHKIQTIFSLHTRK